VAELAARTNQPQATSFQPMGQLGFSPPFQSLHEPAGRRELRAPDRTSVTAKLPRARLVAATVRPQGAKSEGSLVAPVYLGMGADESRRRLHTGMEEEQQGSSSAAGASIPSLTNVATGNRLNHPLSPVWTRGESWLRAGVARMRGRGGDDEGYARNDTGFPSHGASDRSGSGGVRRRSREACLLTPGASRAGSGPGDGRPAEGARGTA